MSDRDEADRLVDWLNDPFNGGDLVTMATLRGAIRAYGDQRVRQAAEEMRERAAECVRSTPWNFVSYEESSGIEPPEPGSIAARVASLPLPPDLGERK